MVQPAYLAVGKANVVVALRLADHVKARALPSPLDHACMGVRPFAHRVLMVRSSGHSPFARGVSRRYDCHAPMPKPLVVMLQVNQDQLVPVSANVVFVKDGLLMNHSPMMGSGLVDGRTLRGDMLGHCMLGGMLHRGVLDNVLDDNTLGNDTLGNDTLGNNTLGNDTLGNNTLRRMPDNNTLGNRTLDFVLANVLGRVLGGRLRNRLRNGD